MRFNPVFFIYLSGAAPLCPNILTVRAREARRINKIKRKQIGLALFYFLFN